MSTSNLNLCLLPIELFWEDKNRNLETVSNLLEKIHPDTDIVILPETFSTGFPSGLTKDYIRTLAEKNTGETVDELKRLALKHNVAIAGSFIANSAGSLYNRAFFIEPSGEEYFADKKHLFTMGGEDKIFSKGAERLKVRFRGWNIAMIVCYDIRFPVWCRNNNNEYDLLIAVANWPIARVAAWNTLLEARALENIAYVCGVNCKGIDKNGYEYDGSSKVIDFKGKDITVKISDEGMLYASLSKEKLHDFRKKFPAWADADKFEIIED